MGETQTCICPLCGNKNSLLQKKHYKKLLKDQVQPEIEAEVKRRLFLIEKKIKNANAGELTPTEEKIVNMIRCARLGRRKAPR